MFEAKTGEIWQDDEDVSEDEDDSEEDSLSSDGSVSVNGLDEVTIEENQAELEIEGDFECVCSVEIKILSD